MEKEVIKLKAKSGNYISLTLRLVENNSKGVVLFCNAIGVNQHYYYNLAKYLTLRNYTTITFDYSGTDSRSNFKKRYNETLFDWSDNIALIINWINENYPEQKINIVAHSIGGQLLGFVKEIKEVNQVIFLATSTGYWKDGKSPQKWKNYFLLKLVMPLVLKIYGYAKMSLFKMGDDYPKNAAIQWRKWCLNKKYFEIDFIYKPTYFEKFDKQITSIWFADDVVANKKTVTKLLTYYTKAKRKVVEISPKEIGVKKIGHTGFLSRKFSDSIWNRVYEIIDRK